MLQTNQLYTTHIRTDPSVSGTQTMGVAKSLTSAGLRTPSFSMRFSLFFHNGTKGVEYWAWPLKYWRCVFL